MPYPCDGSSKVAGGGGAASLSLISCTNAAQAIPVLAMLKDIMKTAAAEAAGVGGPLDPPAGVRRVVFVWVSRHGSEFSLMDEKLLQALR